MMPEFEWKESEEVYLDNAATTMIDPEVLVAMRPYLEERYGNPQTVYRMGREAWDGVSAARNSIAEAIGAEAGEIYFTSGGTESNNWALKGLHLGEKKTILVGAVEHASVLEPAAWMDENGLASVKVVPVDGYGMVMVDVLEKYLEMGGVGLVSIQVANNEVGTVQPVEEISRLCRKHGAVFHCDAVQGLGKVALDVDDLGVDMMSLSAHKIHGPKGIGALYVRKGTNLEPLIHGGGHEKGMRSGTLPTYQIVGFGKAVEMAMVSLRKDMPRLEEMTKRAVDDLEGRLGAKVNGSKESRLPNILSVTLPGMDGGVTCGILCSRYGVCVSSGSACNTISSRASHVLEAMGRKKDSVHTLRLSLSRFTTEKSFKLAVARLEAALRESKERSLI